MEDPPPVPPQTDSMAEISNANGDSDATQDAVRPPPVDTHQLTSIDEGRAQTKSSETDPAADVTEAEHSPSRSPSQGTSVPPTLTFSVNEMEVLASRSGRSGSLSKFVDDADTFRRRSLPSYGDDAFLSSSHQHEKLSLDYFLQMGIDPILEVLEDSDSDIRLWLLTPEVVEDVLRAFIAPPVFEGEPHEEYGYYKRHFICSEIIMKLYTGDDDLYESFSSDSSAGSHSTTSTVFGCLEPADVGKWKLLYSLFEAKAPLDEMQLLFFSKALVRLHDGFCLEDGYVDNILRPLLPLVVPHLYSNTVKYMLTLILQSYESVHPITGRNDAMQIVAPLLIQATRVDVKKRLNSELVENCASLLVDMLQANQADRLGSFCRREGGVYLSKYFVRDQFGTIRGFESMTHGYHNFLQYMLLDELSKHPDSLELLFENAVEELEAIRSDKDKEASYSLVIHVVTELLVLSSKHYADCDLDIEEEMEVKKDRGRTLSSDSDSDEERADAAFGYSRFSGSHADNYASSPRDSTAENAMYNLATLSKGRSLWSKVIECACETSGAYVDQLDVDSKVLPPSVCIALSKYLYALIYMNDEHVNKALHDAKLMQKYLQVLLFRPSFDMMMIHVVPAVAYVLRDAEENRARNCPLTKDLFGESEGGDGDLEQVLAKVEKQPTYTALSVVDIIIRAKSDVPALRPYAAILKDALDEVLSHDMPSQNNAQVRSLCRRNASWRQMTGTMSDPVATPAAIPEDEPVEEQPVEDEEEGPKESSSDRGRSSSGYFKTVLQSPVFKTSMRLGSVIKMPERPSFPQRSSSTGSSTDKKDGETTNRSSFGSWNSMFKRLRKSLVTTPGGTKPDSKLLALSNEPYMASPGRSSQHSEVVTVDTSQGDDIAAFVAHDGGVHVHDVPLSYAENEDKMNVITSGYMYKSKYPETGQRQLWERFYFVLDKEQGSLSYYLTDTHAKDRTFVRGTARPVSVTEGLPLVATGQEDVYGFQINTQGHGAFMVLVDSIDTRLVWLTEIVAAVGAPAPKRTSFVGEDLKSTHPPLSGRLSSGSSSDSSGLSNSIIMNKGEMKSLVVEFYKYLFGPSLKFTTPVDAPPPFWSEGKIDAVSSECVLSSNLPDCVPYWGEFHGYKRLCEYWKLRDETAERSGGRVLRVVIDEDEETAVVMTSQTFRILRNSQIVTEESCDILTISNGAIVSIHSTFDSYKLAEAFRMDGVSAS